MGDQQPTVRVGISPGAFRYFGCVVLLIFVVAAMTISFYVMSQRRIAEAQPTAEAFMDHLVAEDYAAAETMRGPSVLKGDEDRTFSEIAAQQLEQLGALESYTLDRNHPLRLDNGKAIALVYEAQFERATGEVRVMLAERGSGWRVTDLEFVGIRRREPQPTPQPETSGPGEVRD